MSGDVLKFDSDEGEVIFTFWENGALQIELFAQDTIIDNISKDQTDQLAKWLVSRMF